jgi:hypothetical protein
MENTSSVDDITDIELPNLEESGPTYITTLEELVNTRGAVIQQESVDKASLLSIFQPNPSTLKTQLIIWASLGFPDNWKVFSVKVNPPIVCSDGETRGVCPYVFYLLDSPVDVFLTTLDTQVPGVKFSFFVADMNTIGLSVIKP